MSSTLSTDNLCTLIEWTDYRETLHIGDDQQSVNYWFIKNEKRKEVYNNQSLSA